MKKLTAFFAIVSLVLLPHSAEAQALPNFWTSQAASTTAGPYNLNGFKVVSFQITCPSACVGTVLVQLQATPSDSFATVLQIANPTASQLGYYMPPSGNVQFVLNWTSGPFNGSLVRG